MINGLQIDRLGVTFLYTATLQLLNMIYVADQPPKSMAEKFVFSRSDVTALPSMVINCSLFSAAVSGRAAGQ